MEAAEIRRVILDVDVGTDDYMALLLFFHCMRIGIIKIEAIICSSGNTTVQNVCNNVVRLLETTGNTNIPVYRGASRHFIPLEREIEQFHGSDGFGDLEYDHSPDLSIIKDEAAAVAIGNLIKANPNEISLICLAPLTTVAITLRLYDDVSDLIKDIWIMGGNHEGVGNVTPSAEFNFFLDPEAAHIVLNTVTKPVHILTWETSLDTTITFDWRYNVFGIKDNLAVQLLNEAEKKIYADTDFKFWTPCDAFLAAAFLYPDLIIVKSDAHSGSVEIHDPLTRGQLIVDPPGSHDKNINIIKSISSEKFKHLLENL